jgi:hypothetical protein
MIANDEIRSGEFRSANPHPTEIYSARAYADS